MNKLEKILIKYDHDNKLDLELEQEILTHYISKEDVVGILHKFKAKVLMAENVDWYDYIYEPIRDAINKFIGQYKTNKEQPK